ncbi:MAG: hypothetical protein C0187_06490 [Calditerrivibrio nitroreducens]|uniref:TonB C-terminal domain-containing protein n=1 Tax=Calditerrivibrio nitroreducens TaxID=477976 RepID=A0A2J6WH64_9BACT|nr:MAG: hypothetical protein C0187_06490 [Calditerrivibrio nitroreducens]
MIMMTERRLPAFIIFSTIFHILLIVYLKISLPLDGNIEKNRIIFVELINKKNSPFSTNESIKKKVDTTNNKKILKDIQPLYAKNEQNLIYKDAVEEFTRQEQIQPNKIDEDKTKTTINQEEPKTIANNKVETTSINPKSMNIIMSKTEDIKTYPENEAKPFNIEEYERYILQKIKDMIEYPLLARKRGIEGDIMVNVTINRFGELKKVKIVKSSGYTVLDDYTVNLAGKIKFDVSPPHTIELPLKISYRLNR